MDDQGHNIAEYSSQCLKICEYNYFYVSMYIHIAIIPYVNIIATAVKSS